MYHPFYFWRKTPLLLKMFKLFRFLSRLMLVVASCFQLNSGTFQVGVLVVSVRTTLSLPVVYIVLVKGGAVGTFPGFEIGSTQNMKNTQSNLLVRTAFSRAGRSNTKIRARPAANMALYCGECAPASQDTTERAGCSNKGCTCHSTGVCTCVSCACGPSCPCRTTSRLACGCTATFRCGQHQ